MSTTWRADMLIDAAMGEIRTRMVGGGSTILSGSRFPDDLQSPDPAA
jgi:hypothetical protein